MRVLLQDQDCGGECSVDETGNWISLSHGELALSFQDLYGDRLAGKGPFPLCETSTSPGGRTLQLLPVTRHREEASQACERLGNNASLVTISSAAANDEAATTCGDNVCWIGLWQESPGSWTWEDGSTADYTVRSVQP